MVSSRNLMAALAVCIVSLLATASASAATFTVTTTSDNGDGTCDATCSLRDAVSAANANANKDTIVLPAGTVRLERFGVDDANATGDVDIDNAVTIQGAGPGTTTIDATGKDRAIDVDGAEVLLTGMTLTGGLATSEAVTENDSGGAVRARNGSALELDDVVVRGNLAQGIGGTGAIGAGIYSENGSLAVRNSAIVGNTASPDGFGGGIGVSGEGSATMLTNVTVAQNTANRSSGGVFFNQESEAEFAFTTIVENEAGLGEGGVGSNGELLIRSSIVARNSAPSNPDCIAANSPISLGGNVGSASCGFGLPSDFVTADPQLGPLGGAGVPVAEPLAGSPALDRGLAPCPATDARGVARPQGAACDSGAAELQVSSAGTGTKPPAGPPSSPPGKSAVKISGLAVSQTKFRAGPKVARAAKGKPPVGTTISFRLSGAASVKATVLRLVRGRKVGGKCLPATRARRGKPACTRMVTAGSLPTRAFPAGASSIDFNGRVGARNLAPGRYLVELAVAGGSSTATTPALRILP